MNIFAEAAKLEDKNKPFALAQIVSSRGSAPRHSAEMLIREDGTVTGTIGGGMVERRVIDEARTAIREKTSRMFQGRMARNGPDAVGSDCGGALSVYISVHGIRPRLVLIGGGHVNRAIAQSASLAGFDIAVGDIFSESLTPEFFPPATSLVHAETFDLVLANLDIRPDNFVLIATNDKDREVLECLITVPVTWLGMLGSRRKVHTFLRQLRENGVAEEHISRLHAPVGYDIGAETPGEIAVSVMAEILQIKNHARGGLMMEAPVQALSRRVVIRGAGDIATGVALRLRRSGYQVIMLEIDKPTVIRRSVAFAQALFDGHITVENVMARRATSVEEAIRIAENDIIPVLIDPEGESLSRLKPVCVVDAILAKNNTGTCYEMAPAVIALGPGFCAGKDCHAVVETNRGHWLGSVIYQGEAQKNTGIPGNVMGYTSLRVIRASISGVFFTKVEIGVIVEAGDVIACIDDTDVVAPISGMVRGLLNDGLVVTHGFKIGDIDPRGTCADCTSVSDKARSIGGGVLEALMALTRCAASPAFQGGDGVAVPGANGGLLDVLLLKQEPTGASQTSV